MDPEITDATNDEQLDTAPPEVDITQTTDDEQPSKTEAAAAALTDDKPEDLPTDSPVPSKVKSLLDTISADVPTKPKAEADKPAGDDKPEGDKPKAEAKPKDEEAEILEGVKSERGQARIREVFRQKKEMEGLHNELREALATSKMNEQEFAQSLEFSRLAKSDDPKDLQVAIGMLEQQRTELYRRVGQEAPGVDLLEGHDDLKKSVENMEITQAHAVELAKRRREDAQRQARDQQQQETQQSREQFQQTLKSAAQTMESYLQSRAGEVDHPVRLKTLMEHFKNPDNAMKFVQTYEPKQWLPTLKMMYDGVKVAAPRNNNQQQPIRSRTQQLGMPAPTGDTPIDRVASVMDRMGL